MTDDNEEGVIVEFTRLGAFVKITAIDTVTMREVSVMGSPRVPQKQLADLAVRKLRYVLKRDKK